MEFITRLLSRVIGRLRLELIKIPKRSADARRGTYAQCSNHKVVETCLYNYSLPKLSIFDEARHSAISHFLSHRFDLLGSGWVLNMYGQAPFGLEGIVFPISPEPNVEPTGKWLEGRVNGSNLDESMRVWRLICGPYRPIDWQLDIKSGFRWREDCWSMDIKTLGPLGSDIKLPWELARMQHLPQLALTYLDAEGIKKTGINRDQLAQEFRNQVLDFIATNPPRYGVNWVCSMDVAIRVSNWLVAYDLLTAGGVKFDHPFVELFARSVYEHGEHLINNLEWNCVVRGNHYLANILGLLFVSSHLECEPKIDMWLAFSVQEFINETSQQFHNEGSNFEASTSYHRLSAQMLTYGAALLSGLSLEKTGALGSYDSSLWTGEPHLRPAPAGSFTIPGRAQPTPLPEWVYDRIGKAVGFTACITKPDGLIPQVGDCDSGFFIKLCPQYERLSREEWEERYLSELRQDGNPHDNWVVDEEQRDHHHLIAEVAGLFGETLKGREIEATLTATLANQIQETKVFDSLSRAEYVDQVGSEEMWQEIQKMENSKHWFCETAEIVLPNNNKGALTLHGFADFGVFIFKSSEFYLSVRCGEVGQNGIGGHAHNDQLSMELNIDGKDITFDPGTYLYTPFPEQRNGYRSVQAHFAPHVGDHEPAGLDKGLFYLSEPAPGKCLYYGQKGFIGMHTGYSQPVYRVIEILDDHIRVKDLSTDKALKPISFSPPPLSPRYGIQFRNQDRPIFTQ